MLYITSRTKSLPRNLVVEYIWHYRVYIRDDIKHIISYLCVIFFVIPTYHTLFNTLVIPPRFPDTIKSPLQYMSMYIYI